MYTAKDIRNLALLGHGGDGKSALCESMLYVTKAITRLGKRADGTTVSDFDDEEKKRQYSIKTSVIPVEFGGCKLNVLDNPGYFDFAAEIVQSLRVADAGLICLTAKSGIAVGTEKGWKSLADAGLPAMFYVSKLDEEHANFFNTFDSLRDIFGASVIPFTFPILHGEEAVGVVDLVSKKAYDVSGKEIALPAEAEEKIEEYMAELNEQVAETDEALMEKFFMEEPFTEEELLKGIKEGIRQRSVTPVFCGCAMNGLGTAALLDNLVRFAPSPLEGKPAVRVDEEGKESEFPLNPDGPATAFVFNTVADQYGKNSYFKVLSGNIEDTMTVVNARTGDNEKLGNTFFPKGKDNAKTAKVCCGDIGVFTKLASVRTGDTLCQPGKLVTIKPMTYAEPCYRMAIYAKTKGQEDKVAAGLVKLNEEGIRQRSVTPVFCGCAMNGLGTAALLDNLVRFAPSPLEGKPAVRVDEEGKESEFPLNPDGPATAFVFNTVADQYGKNSYFKVLSGNIEDTMTVVNARTGDNEKLGNTFFPKGKDNAKTAKVCCGDIGVFTKLASVRTGDTLCQPGKLVTIKPMTYAEPCYRMAIYAKTKGQEDKVAAGLVKLNEEDASFTYGNDPETKEMIIAGVCDIHLSVIIAKLLSKYKVEAELRPAKIAYRETIKKKVEIHGRHKKQSGGHGQFGDVYIRFEPQSESEDMIFADETVGGCVPKNFIPSVEKGLRNCIGKGVLAGYPVVFLKSTLYFGSYHPVDSSDMAFQTAAGIAYKEGLPTAGPTLLEPIGELKVFIPDANMGDIIGDLNKRRGRVMGMNPDPDNRGWQIVEAEVPMGEMSSYAIDLRSMSQGRGSYSLKFVRYEEVPQINQAKIIEDAKKADEE